jgi:hypothetical protein
MKSGWQCPQLAVAVTEIRGSIVYADFWASVYWQSACREIGLRCWLNQGLIDRGAAIVGAHVF